MIRWLGLVALVGLLVGCERSLSSQVDELLFDRWGRTLLAHPDTLTLKEIHLGSGAYTGRDVIIEGKVAQVSDHGTYAVITDDEARMLVVLTDLVKGTPGSVSAWPRSVRVLGTIERGKKGLPLLRAHALSWREPLPAATSDGKA